MKRRLFIALACIVTVSLSALAQETVYPVLPKSDIPVLLTEDHFGFVVEKTFQYKLTFGFPSMDKAWFVPGTKTRLVMLWLRVENLSAEPLKLDTSKFTSVDDTGRMYKPLSADETYAKIMSGVAGTEPTLASKTLKGISLGKKGNTVTADQIKDDILRYGLQSEMMPPRSIKDGLIYFEAPEKKKFTISVSLGDLWSRPFVFSTSKPK
ncbi:MAG TPA: hypothetical protein VKY31_05790 [Terriglobia bacterium]|nr:hypothetical protein [Terriglobia bacterium]